jgi:tetratricopeptide (TPR) repeat protein
VLQASDVPSKLEPQYVPAIVNLAICYHNIGELDQAIALYDHAAEISPDDAQIIYNKTYLFYEQDRQSESHFRLQLFRSLLPNTKQLDKALP